MRVVIADDSALFREGLSRMLAEAGVEVAGLASDASELMGFVRTEPVDVAIVDIRMPPTKTDEGLVAARAIQEERPEVGVLVLSTYVDTDFAATLVERNAQRAGYLLKDRVADARELIDALERIARGSLVVDPAVVAQLLHRQRTHDPVDELTDREGDVLALMAEGRSNQAIGERLFLSPRTVESHVGSIFSKLGLAPAPDDHRRVLAVLTYLRA